jgi:hypothetical protein
MGEGRAGFHLDFGHDPAGAEDRPLDRYGARGCFAHTMAGDHAPPREHTN